MLSSIVGKISLSVRAVFSIEVLNDRPAPRGCEGRGWESKMTKSGLSGVLERGPAFALANLKQAMISGGRVMIITADLSIFFMFLERKESTML